MSPQAGVTAVSAWGTQYRAIYVPVRVPRRVTVLELGAAVESTSTGNVDIGLYDRFATRLVSTGSTVKLSSLTQAIEATDTTIGPGLYYLALNNDTTTDTFTTWSLTAPAPAANGVLTETLGAVTLPATATWALDNTLTIVPVISALLVTEVS
jgi:hypothetical protein